MLQTKFLLPSVYNPLTQTEQETKENFVIRLKEFEYIFSAIKNDEMKYPPQHFIIQGQRGSGKTTLLLRLYYEVRNDENLKKWLIPVIFNEEQYNVTKLYRLWENIIRHLDIEEETEEFIGLYDEMIANSDSESYEDDVYELLKKTLKENNKKLVLFIDNFGEMLSKFTEKESQRLREILLENNDIRIIGGSAISLEANFDYSNPFYEFFQIVQLDGLDETETINLLRRLGENYKNEREINKIIEKSPGRINALRILTGGVPRTIVLLYEIFVDNETGDSFKDLEMILDRVTPLYKHRMDELPVQQQEIMHVLALNWDAIAVKDISKQSRIESKQVSAQLNLLEKNGIIEKKPTSTKNNFYQIKERFFNIWYLMRYGGRKNENRVKWLVKFLESWCDKKELLLKAEKHIEGLQKGKMYEKYVVYMTQAFYNTTLPNITKEKLIMQANQYLTKVNIDLIKELPKTDNQLLKESIKYIKDNNLNLSLRKLLLIRNRTSEINKRIGILYAKLAKYDEAFNYLKICADEGDAFSMVIVASICIFQYHDIKKAEIYYLKAIEKGENNALMGLALLYHESRKNIKKAEEYYLKAVEKGIKDAAYQLGNLYLNEIKDYKKAEQYFLLEIEKGNDAAMNNLAILYATEFINYEKAEQYYIMAAEKGNTNALIGLVLLNFYLNKNENKKKILEFVEKFFEKSKNNLNSLLYVILLLWNNDISHAIEISEKYIETNSFDDEFIIVDIFLLMLIAKKQYNYSYKLFSNNKLNLIDKYKPIYYALMKLMQDTYPDEYKKMGKELEEPVNEVLARIKQMEIDYK